jgi:alpha-D-ribose 1-methylphosphonate 5-triphosphate synthase subunit PhnG
MAVLARSDMRQLAACWAGLGLDPAFAAVRGPETGLVMLRGRIGGDGEPFNLGEATVTRATVRLADGAVGHAMALGTDRGKAQLAAVIDALCQSPELAARVDAEIIEPLARDQAAADAGRREETAATRVDFFTMARGED